MYVKETSQRVFRIINVRIYEVLLMFFLIFLSFSRVKSGILGQTAKFGHPYCLFHSSTIEIKIN